jgi:hypothetical protein
VKRAGRAVELRLAPKARVAAHHQERSLIAGPASTAFWRPDGPERAPALGRRRSRSKVGYWCKSSRCRRSCVCRFDPSTTSTAQ